MTSPVEVRADLARKLRRGLVGPGPAPEDADLEREALRGRDVPSRWYLTGYLAPQEELRDVVAASEDDEIAYLVAASLLHFRGSAPEPPAATPSTRDLRVPSLASA